MRTLRTLILISLLLPAAGWTQTTAPEKVRKTVSEKLICYYDPSTFAELPIFSPDNRRMAYVAKGGKKLAVVVDGKEEKPHDVIVEGTFIFSPDSRRVAYEAMEILRQGLIVDVKRFVVVDGKEEKPYDGIGKGSLIFSPDSRLVAYAARSGANSWSSTWSVVVDGKEEKSYYGIGEGTPIFSPDSRRMAYVAKVGKKSFVVVDGKEEKSYDGIGDLIFARTVGE